MLFEVLSVLCLISGLGLLILLSIIDFRTFLLPNIYVFPFAILGIAFHIFTSFYFLSITEIIIGGIAGYSLLWIIRFMGNKYYGQDSLGLGDVKLLGAGGLWLGLEGVLFAMTLGALAILLYGLVIATHKKLTTSEKFSISRMVVPAGPGFIAGIIIVGAWMYKNHVVGLFYDWFA